VDWLTPDPSADVRGALLLMLYLAAVVLTVAACRRLFQRCDPTPQLPMPMVPADPDPYEIAYLRDGVKAVTNCLIFALIQQGYLQVVGKRPGKRQTNADRQIAPAGPSSPWRACSVERQTHADREIAPLPGAPERRRLTEMEQLVFDGFSRPRAAGELAYPPRDLQRQVAPGCAPYEERLRREQLLPAPDAQGIRYLVALAGYLTIIGLSIGLWMGLSIVAGAQDASHNSFFLVLTVALNMIALSQLYEKASLGSTARGKAYLQRLQIAFGPLRQQARDRPPTDPAWLLLVALFGITAALADTAYDELAAITSEADAAANCSSCGG
jgi:uncharacterized protein (TIGR04222 family)